MHFFFFLHTDVSLHLFYFLQRMAPEVMEQKDYDFKYILLPCHCDCIVTVKYSC